MIKAVFFTDKQSRLSGFRISGHSMLAESGSDVLCAFVSSAAYMTANTITDIICANATAEVHDGDMKVMVCEKIPDCQVILEGLLLHLSATEKQYPDYLKTVCSVV